MDQWLGRVSQKQAHLVNPAEPDWCKHDHHQCSQLLKIVRNCRIIKPNTKTNKVTDYRAILLESIINNCIENLQLIINKQNWRNERMRRSTLWPRTNGWGETGWGDPRFKLIIEFRLKIWRKIYKVKYATGENTNDTRQLDEHEPGESERRSRSKHICLSIFVDFRITLLSLGSGPSAAWSRRHLFQVFQMSASSAGCWWWRSVTRWRNDLSACPSSHWP